MSFIIIGGFVLVAGLSYITVEGLPSDKKKKEE